MEFLKFSVQEFILAVGLCVGSEGGKVNDGGIVNECLKGSDQSCYQRVGVLGFGFGSLRQQGVDGVQIYRQDWHGGR